MHIVMINGSHKKSPGFTSLLLDELAAGARETGASVESFALAMQRLKPCAACGACQIAGSGRCLLARDDGAEAIFDAIRRADIVVYATPVYVFAPSSLLKSFLERFYALGSESRHVVSPGGLLFHEVEEAVARKPFAYVITSDNMERETTLGARRYFRTFSRFLGAPLSGELVRDGGRLIRSGKAAVGVEDVRAAFRQAGRELARDGRVARGTQRAAARRALPVPRLLLALLKTTSGGRRALVERSCA